MGDIMKFSKVISFVFVVMSVTSAIAQQDQSDRDRGIDLYREGKFAEAIVALEAATVSNESDRAAWMYLGGAYANTDQEGKASKAFGRMSGTKQAGPPPRYDKSVKITWKPRPGYTDEARRNGSSGTVRVAVEFRADGKIGFTFPLPTLIRDLIPPSINAAKQIKFEPAVKDGKPITVINIVEYGYRTR
jgi:hypothetical protein